MSERNIEITEADAAAPMPTASWARASARPSSAIWRPIRRRPPRSRTGSARTRRSTRSSRPLANEPRTRRGSTRGASPAASPPTAISGCRRLPPPSRWSLLGGAIGWGGRDAVTPVEAASDALIDSAVTAHALYVKENRHAVEVAAE